MIKQFLQIMHAAGAQGVTLEMQPAANCAGELIVTVRKQKSTVCKNNASFTYHIDGDFETLKDEDISHDFVNSLKRSIHNLGVKI